MPVTAPDPLPVRTINDVATIKALADPTRLAILRELMQGSPAQPPVLSVKELAQRLGEPQTKLYRHVKQLEAHQLIVVAETRMVSGIQEQRYRAGQFSVDFEPELLGQPATHSVITLAVENFRDELAAALRTGRIRFETDIPADETYRKFVASHGRNRVPAARANEFRQRLAALIHEMTDDAEYDEHGVPINFLAVFYAPTEP